MGGGIQEVRQCVQCAWATASETCRVGGDHSKRCGGCLGERVLGSLLGYARLGVGLNGRIHFACACRCRLAGSVRSRFSAGLYKAYGDLEAEDRTSRHVCCTITQHWLILECFGIFPERFGGWIALPFHCECWHAYQRKQQGGQSRRLDHRRRGTSLREPTHQ